MNVKTFIDRPVLAGVISVIILIVGVIALVLLPIEQFPNIAPPHCPRFGHLHRRKCRNRAEKCHRAP